MSQITRTVTYIVNRHGVRLNSLTRFFFGIAQRHAEILLKDEKEPATLLDREADPEAYYRHQDELFESVVQCVVYSAMACEAAINELAAMHLTDKTAYDIDRLSTENRWKIVPRLICGVQLDPEAAAMQGLHDLFVMRNKLLHYKSLDGVPVDDSVEAWTKMLDEGKAQMEKISDAWLPAIKTVILLSLELNRVMGFPTCVLPVFEKEIRKENGIKDSPHFEELLSKCRGVDKKAANRAAMSVSKSA